MKKSLIISEILITSWRNQLGKLTAGNPVIIATLWLFVLISCISLFLINKEFVYPLFSELSTDPKGLLIVFTLFLANISLVISALLAFFIMISPTQTYLDHYLAMMPVNRGQKMMGYYFPLIAITTGLAALLYLPMAFPFILRGSISFTAGALIVAGVLFHILMMVLFHLIVYILLYILLERFFWISPFFGKITASSFMVLGSVVTFFATFQSLQPERVDMPINHSNALILILRDPLQGKLGVGELLWMVAVLFGIVFLTWLLYWLTGFSQSVHQVNKYVWLKHWPFGNHPFTVYFAQELKQTVRQSENVIFALFFVLVSISVVILVRGTEIKLDALFMALVPLLVWFAASLFAQNSYGRTQPTHWLRQVVPVPRIVWLLSKMAANFTFTTFVAILLFVVLSFGSDHLPFLSFLRHTVDGLFLTLLFTWIGVVFPYSEEYPYSSAVSTILLMVILLPVYYGMQKLLLIAPRELIPYMGLTGCLLMMYLIYQTDHWRSSP